MKYKTKNTIKTIAMSVLGVAILVGGASLISNIVEKNSADDDGLVLVNPTFKVGGLDANGKYVDDDGTIYTNEAFECQGLQIKLDFEKTIDYEVFFYNELGEYLSSSGIQSENLVANVPQEATHARVEITPDWEALDITKEKDQVIKWYEVSKYSKQMEIKVNEEQGDYVLGDFEQVALTNSMFTLDEGVYYTASGSRSESADYNTYTFVATEKCSFYMDYDNLITLQYVIVRTDGTAVRYQLSDGSWIGGEDNSFVLNEGDVVHVSLQTTSNIDNVYFYLANYVIE